MPKLRLVATSYGLCKVVRSAPKPKPKRPTVRIPVCFIPVNGGLADKDGFKVFVMQVGPAEGCGGMPYVYRQVHVSVADTQGAAKVRFFVQHFKGKKP